MILLKVIILPSSPSPPNSQWCWCRVLLSRRTELGGEGTDRAINILDKTPCTMTFKIGVLYVGASQSTEEQVLSNTYGSPRYIKVCTYKGSFLTFKRSLQRLPSSSSFLNGLAIWNAWRIPIYIPADWIREMTLTENTRWYGITMCYRWEKLLDKRWYLQVSSLFSFPVYSLTGRISCCHDDAKQGNALPSLPEQEAPHRKWQRSHHLLRFSKRLQPGDSLCKKFHLSLPLSLSPLLTSYTPHQQTIGPVQFCAHSGVSPGQWILSCWGEEEEGGEGLRAHPEDADSLWRRSGHCRATNRHLRRPVGLPQPSAGRSHIEPRRTTSAD